MDVGTGSGSRSTGGSAAWAAAGGTRSTGRSSRRGLEPRRSARLARSSGARVGEPDRRPRRSQSPESSRRASAGSGVARSADGVSGSATGRFGARRSGCRRSAGASIARRSVGSSATGASIADSGESPRVTGSVGGGEASASSCRTVDSRQVLPRVVEQSDHGSRGDGQPGWAGCGPRRRPRRAPCRARRPASTAASVARVAAARAAYPSRKACWALRGPVAGAAAGVGLLPRARRRSRTSAACRRCRARPGRAGCARRAGAAARPRSRAAPSRARRT